MKKYVNGEYVEMTEEEIKHIEEILKENKATQEPTIEEQILALQNALITSKISGGGITTITDSSENRIKNLKVLGKSVQEITKSYNLFPIPKVAEVKNEQGSFKRVNTDGSVTIKNVANNSTTPNDWSVLNAKNEGVFEDNPELPPGDYSLFLDGTSDSENKTVQILIALETSGVAIIRTNKDLGWHGFTIAQKEKMKILYRPQRLNENYEVTIKAMVTTRENKGKPFMKYGINEISPESPLEIISVGNKGSVKLEVKGNNSELQEFNINTPNGLHGLQVNANGNYTDATGRQWICDEIDLARGKYVQRIKEKYVVPKSYSSHTERKWILTYRCQDTDMNAAVGGSNAFKSFMCTRFSFKDITKESEYDFSFVGAYRHVEYVELRWYILKTDCATIEEAIEYASSNILYPTATPIETDLPPETITAFKTLHSNYPTTVISNDENAGMEVSYIADTKLYIDKKFEELNQAIVNTQIALL